MWKYLKFMILPLVVTAGTAASFVFGGIYMWFGLAFLLVVGLGGELISGEDTSEPEYSYEFLFDWNTYIITLFLAVSTVTFVWSFSSIDLLGIGAFVQSMTGIDVLAARGQNVWWQHLGAALSLGGILGVQGITVGHELTHRTDDPFDMLVGRWCFALMFGTNFATEHVHGHHHHLGHSELDPVSVKRGTGFYNFLTVGTFNQWRGGWRIERERLNAKGKSFWNIDNQVLRAYFRGGLVAAGIAYFGGWIALAWWVLAIAYAKYILEGLNFFSHYGIVREPGEPITLRHTFSSNNAIGNYYLLNLGRHGSHHLSGGRYQNFEAGAGMPMSPYGYITMTVISWMPPLFWWVMTPAIKEWEEKYATDGEREIVRQHNLESGRKELEEFVPQQMQTSS